MYLKSISCPICDKSVSDFLFKINDQVTQINGDFNLVKCSGCNLIFLNPRPHFEDMNLFYPSSYGPYIDKPRKETRKVISNFFEFNELYLENVNDGKTLLEIGAANGTYLEKMRDLGWQCLAVEPSSEACHTLRSKGFTVFNSTIESLNLNEQFDVIVMWMVVEHIYDLKSSVSKLRNMCKNDGMFVFSVPNVNCLSFKLFKRHWHNIHGPAHLQHFSEETIEILLNECGWQIKRIKYHRKFSDFLSSLANWLEFINFIRISMFFRSMSKSILLKYLLFVPALIYSSLFGSSRMTIYAKPYML